MPIVPEAYLVKKIAIHIGADASHQVATMLDRQNLDGMTASRRDFAFGAIGCLGGGPLPAQGNLCFFTGVPINGSDTDELIDAKAAARLFGTWDGAFNGIFWDAEQEVLVVATDCLGMQPLYMQQTDDELTLVSETKAMRGDPDLAAWGAFISIGHPIGERSLMSGLQRVPPASVLTYDCARRRLDIFRYWDWPEPSNAWNNYDFLDALERDICGYAALTDQSTLLLSGGFDSRLLLHLLQRSNVPVDALIVAHQDVYGDADGRLAEAAAKRTGARYQKAWPPENFFSSQAYLDYLRDSDVGYPSLDLFIAKVASQIESNAVWDGLVPGFVFMSPHQPEGSFDAYLQQEIPGPDSTIWRAARTLFRREIVDAMSEGFTNDLQAEVSRHQQNAYGLAQLFIENRMRHRPAMNPLKIYANRTRAFTPGLSKNFMSHAAIIPFEEKQHGRFYRSLFSQLDNRSLTIPFLSGEELLKNAKFGPAYYRQRLLISAYNYRARHPTLFPGMRPHQPERSGFIGSHLFQDEGKWLKPNVHEKLTTVNTDNYVVWRLLSTGKLGNGFTKAGSNTSLARRLTIKLLLPTLLTVLSCPLLGWRQEGDSQRSLYYVGRGVKPS